MMKYILVAFIALYTWACVTTGDLQEFSTIQREAIEAVSEAQRQHQLAVEALLEDTTKTDEEILTGLAQLAKEREAVVKEIAEQTGQSVEELIQVIQDRTKAVAGAAGTLTGNALVDMLISIAVGGGAAAMGVNQIRDKRRMVRGEPTGVLPLTHT